MNVVFRVFPRSENNAKPEVIALFCDSAQDCRPGNVMSYMHMGQHGEAARCLGRSLKLATPDQYAPLKRELESIYHPEPIVPVNRLRANAPRR